MALTASTTRVTRSKRTSNVTSVESNTTRATTSTTTMTASAKISSTTATASPKSTTKTIKSSSLKSKTSSKMSITTRAAAALDDEKENIDPDTGLDPLQTAALKSGKSKKVFGAGRNANVATTSGDTNNKVKAALAAPSAPKPSGSRAKKPRASGTVGSGEETIAGRLLALRRNETHADRLARDLTVRPLVDLSEAFGIVEKPIIVSKEEETTATAATEEQERSQEERDDEEPSVHALIAAELDAALRVLALTTDEHKRLPTVLQRTRGVKRQAIHSPATSGFSQTSTSSENVHDSRRLSDPFGMTSTSTSTSRPTKRMRKSAPGTATPKFTRTAPGVPTFDDANIPCAPPNSPVRAARALPSADDFVPITATASIPILIPVASTSQRAIKSDDEEETQDTSASASFDNTQGSSHFSSFLSSFRGTTASFIASSFGVSTHVHDDEEEESREEESGGSWSRWL